MTHSPRNIAALFLLAAAALTFGLVAGVAPASAKGKPACWKTLINDWYDGRIDGTYPIHCYREALQHLPTDVDTYSSAREDIKQALQKELGIENSMAVPRIEKIVVNMGLGEATQNNKLLDPLVNDLAQVTGQKPVTTKGKKSIAAFKVRAGMSIGAMVTLRNDKAYEFLDRLISTALPSVRDFRGVSMKSFDGRGNYSIGIKEHIIFPEIDYDKAAEIWGMDVVVCTTARTDAEARALLGAFNFPFRQ